MLTVKLFHRDGTIILEQANRFVWDTDTPATFSYQDFEGADTQPDPEILRVMVYAPGGVVIFTRDLTTGQPVEFFNV